jgi:PAS domain S-box-containing protein
MTASDGTLSDLVTRAKEEHIIPRGELRQLMDNLPVGLYWNLPGDKGTFLYVNKTLVDMFGYASREDFMNIAAADLYHHPGDREEFSRRLLDDRKLQGIELKLKKKDGSLIWCRESCHAVHDAEGNVICFHGVIEDISGYKRREDQLRAVNRLATQISGTMGIDNLLRTLAGQARRLVDADLGLVARVDEGGRRISAIYPSNFSAEGLPPEIDVPLSGAMHQLVSGNELFTDNLQHKYKDGLLASWCPALRATIGVPVSFQDRLLALVLVGRTSPGHTFTAEDLEIIRTMASLAAISIHSADQFASLVRADAFNRKILETATTAVFTVDPERRITSVNEAFCQVTGMHAEEVTGRHCSVLATSSCESGCALFDCGGGAPQLHLECQVSAGDGRRLSIIRNAALLMDEKGKPMGGVESFIDISELIAQRRSAEAASTAKSSFLANMSHEIRTPLNGIMGMIELALTTEMTGEQQDYLNTVKTCADSLLSLINDVLDLSKIEAGKLELERINFDLRELVDGVLDVMAHPAASKSLELIGHVDSTVPHQVEGDPTRLRQILINLVGNAIKFTDTGEVLLKVCNESVRDGGPEIIRFIVSDTGVGIPEDKMVSIFESFTQADESTTRNFGGTGLGLTISRELVEMMGGTLGLETMTGKGSSFFFTLPLKTVQMSRPEANSPVPLNLEGTRVLVVDDNSNNRLILRQELGRLGCIVTESDSGPQAIEIIARSEGTMSYDLVILDLKLPGLDGFAAAEQIRTSTLKQQPRLLVMTALGVRGDATRCRDIGIDGYLVKPIKRPLLLEAINRVMAPQPQAGAAPGPGPQLVTRYSLKVENAKPSNTILLAEDHPVNTKLAVKLLQDAGYAVLTAATGLEALQRLETEEVDLVLMDIQMPEMDGLEATQKIREQAKFADLPIIAMTAHAMAGDRSRCLQAGMNDYISKPIRQELLIGLISRCLGHGSGKMNDYHAATTSGSHDRKNQPVELPGSGEEVHIDLKKALALVSGDRGFLVELLREYLDDIPHRLEKMKRGIEDADADAVRRTAHSIKGASTSLGTEKIGSLALHLEARAATGNLDDAPDLHREILDRFIGLEAFLKMEFPEIGNA